MSKYDISASVGLDWSAFRDGMQAVKGVTKKSTEEVSKLLGGMAGALGFDEASGSFRELQSYFDDLKRESKEAKGSFSVLGSTIKSQFADAVKSTLQWSGAFTVLKKLMTSTSSVMKTAWAQAANPMARHMTLLAKGFRGVQTVMATLLPSISKLGNLFKFLTTPLMILIKLVVGVTKAFIQFGISVFTTVAKIGLTIMGLGVAAVAGFGALMLHSMKAGKELDSLSRKTQFAVRELVLLEHTIHRSGLSAEEGAGMMAHLREAMVLNSAGTMVGLQMLGLQFEKINSMSLPDRFAAIATQINKLSSPIQRAQLATQLLGSAGADAVANFQEGDADKAVKKFGRLAEIAEASHKSMQMAADAWSNIKSIGQSFFQVIAARMAPLFEKVTVIIESWIPKAIEFGENVGTALSEAVETMIGLFKDGTLSKALSLSFQIGVMWFKNHLVAAIHVAAELLKKSFGGSALAFGETLANPSFWSGMWNMLKGIFMGVQGLMLKAATGFIKAMMQWSQGFTTFLVGFGIGFSPTSARAMFDILKNVESAGKNADAMLNTSASLIGEASADFLAAMKGVDWSSIFPSTDELAAWWKAGLEKGISTSDLEKQLKAMIAQANKTGKAVVGPTKAGAAPGEDAIPGVIRMVTNQFDAFRRSGGGLGKAMMEQLGIAGGGMVKRMGTMTSGFGKGGSGFGKGGSKVLGGGMSAVERQAALNAKSATKGEGAGMGMLSKDERKINLMQDSNRTLKEIKDLLKPKGGREVIKNILNPEPFQTVGV